jgi:poly(3-hydroxybutyrate) depolymerase
VGAVEPRPIVIALHGGADRPEWQCSVWRSIAGPRPFVLCPRGVARGSRFGWGTPDQTTRELRGALTALKKKYGDHVAAGPVTLAGYGPGAAQAVSVAKQEPSFFARVALVNGGSEAFTATNAAVFAHGRGKRVLFVCGLPACRADAERAALFARHAGIPAKLLALETGAAFDATLIVAVRQQWSWLASDAASP